MLYSRHRRNRSLVLLSPSEWAPAGKGNTPESTAGGTIDGKDRAPATDGEPTLAYRILVISMVVVVLVVLPLYASGAFDRTHELTLAQLVERRKDNVGMKFEITGTVVAQKQARYGYQRSTQVVYDDTVYRPLWIADEEAKLVVYVSPDDLASMPEPDDQVRVVGRVRKLPDVSLDRPSTVYIPESHSVLLIASKISGQCRARPARLDRRAIMGWTHRAAFPQGSTSVDPSATVAQLGAGHAEQIAERCERWLARQGFGEQRYSPSSSRVA